MKDFSEQQAISWAAFAMQPDMKDYDADMMFWMDYATELDHVSIVCEDGGVDAVIDRLNGLMLRKPSTCAEHQAATDVASTLEARFPHYFKGKFKY